MGSPDRPLQPRGKLRQSSERAIVLLLISSAIVHGTLLWKERKQIASGYGDFSALYTGGSLVARGVGGQLYDDQQQWKIQQEFARGVNIRRALCLSSGRHSMRLFLCPLDGCHIRSQS